MAGGARITDYEAFWLFYLSEHADPRTRAMHYVGTFIAVFGIVVGSVLGQPWFLIGVPIAGYGPAWIAHVFIEKNRPASFRYPLWSLVSDFRMTWAWATGGLDPDLKRAGVIAEIPRQR